MRKRLTLLGIGAIALLVAAATLALAPRSRPAASPAAAAIDNTEHARTIEAMRPPKRKRPVIAIIALNDATEVTDFLIPYGVLQRADVADVIVVAERSAPVPLHPFSAQVLNLGQPDGHSEVELQPGQKQAGSVVFQIPDRSVPAQLIFRYDTGGGKAISLSASG